MQSDDEVVEAVARAIWEQQCRHWGRYRDQIPDLCGWDDLTESKQREVIRANPRPHGFNLMLTRTHPAATTRGAQRKGLW